MQNVIVLEDIDITQDFAGCFNKAEVTNVMSNSVFHIQEDVYYGDGEGTVLDNSNYVEKNCLTYISGDARSKIYNMFAQEVETDSVRENFGHHLYGWCHAGEIHKGLVKGALEHLLW